MDKLRVGIGVAVALCGLLLLLMVLEWAALHDIAHDYVSLKVMEQHASSAIVALPDWAQCPGEWSVVTFGFLARGCLLVTNTVLLGLCFRLSSIKP
ncbi:MAG: hypothetical protein HN348_15285 [Proteobacteria bacterium]|jgi:hypothetical protein|nr:hypothetical protein [Pseudomonadota bacterium]